MRISGNYFDRLLYAILPLSAAVFLLLYFLINDPVIIPISFITVGLYWIMDTVCLLYKKPTSLRLEGDTLFLGKRNVQPNDIFKITQVTDRRYKWSFEMVEFQLTDGEVIQVINKPQFFWDFLLGKPTVTIKKLLDEFPELKAKLKG